jgi:SAM-dependent methyltransferase
MHFELGKHDIGKANLRWALQRSEDPDTLRALVALGREQFSWFSKQVSRAFEYPWVAKALSPAPARPVLDIGAGISPLPLFLCRRGVKVVTIDNSPAVRRIGEGQHEWNGWGFLDYSTLHPDLRSIHGDALETDFSDGEFSAVYSVSVLEHLPSHERRKLWDRIRRWLEPGARLLVSVDLVPGTDQLWNRNLGQEVERPEDHGDLAAMVGELEGTGFQATDRVELRELPEMDVDCAMLSFVKD